MQRSSIGSTGTSCSTRQALISARGVRTRWLFVMLAVLLAPANLSAQTATTKSETAATADPANVVPLGRYVPKENLFFYFEFAGLDAHDEAWKKTAACKMLYDTPLGGMLEEVCTQLLDKGLSSVPDMKFTGAEIVSLVKNTARSGFVMALHIDPKAKEVNDTLRGTFVLRGAASKPIRGISARLMGWVMGAEAKPKIEFREGRSRGVRYRSVGLHPIRAGLGGPRKMTWWLSPTSRWLPRRPLPPSPARTPAPSIIRSFRSSPSPREPFTRSPSAFIDVAGCPETPTRDDGRSTPIGRDMVSIGWMRVGGFDDDALATITRLAAPKPRQPLFAIFDQQPTFEKTSLLPLPEGVESFLELSMNPAQLFETINTLGLSGGVKAQIDEFTEEIQSTGKIDLQKDLLAQLGPKMVLYLAPGRSAATTNEESSLESVVSKGFNPMAAAAGLPSLFPKLTMVAEVKNPVAFGKSLDAVIIALNNELKAQAVEIATHERQAEGDQAPGGGDARRRSQSRHEAGRGRRPNQAPPS